MNLSNLTPEKGSIHTSKKRVGRGQGSGKGGTLQEVTKELSQDLGTLKN